MKGTDLTQQQLDAAEKFVRARNVCAANNDLVVGDVCVIVKFTDLVRIVAWYGQIRAVAVSKGADPDKPGGCRLEFENLKRGSDGGRNL